jgi:hypothetical protein
LQEHLLALVLDQLVLGQRVDVDYYPEQFYQLDTVYLVFLHQLESIGNGVMDYLVYIRGWIIYGLRLGLNWDNLWLDYLSDKIEI